MKKQITTKTAYCAILRQDKTKNSPAKNLISRILTNKGQSLVKEADNDKIN